MEKKIWKKFGKEKSDDRKSKGRYNEEEKLYCLQQAEMYAVFTCYAVMIQVYNTGKRERLYEERRVSQ